MDKHNQFKSTILTKQHKVKSLLVWPWNGQSAITDFGFWPHRWNVRPLSGKADSSGKYIKAKTKCYRVYVDSVAQDQQMHLHSLICELHFSHSCYKYSGWLIGGQCSYQIILSVCAVWSGASQSAPVRKAISILKTIPYSNVVGDTQFAIKHPRHVNHVLCR